MDSTITEILAKIQYELSLTDLETPSLMQGKAGKELYNLKYLQYIKDTNNEHFETAVQDIAESSINYAYPSFCSGKSGINWFFTYLHKSGILNKEDCKLICSDDIQLANVALNMLQNYNYDFLHGATGIAYYLLYAKSTEFPSFFPRFFDLLKILQQKSKTKITIPFYDLKSGKIVPNQVNLGLAHGIPSLLKFCLECYKQNICQEEAKLMGTDIINFIITRINKDKSKSYFGQIVEVDKEIDMNSRLAWCYGDLSLSYILYQAGVVFNDITTTNFAIEVMLNTTNRHDSRDIRIFDACVCHGSAGLAHIYNKIWHSTKETTFKEACDFWIQKTIRFAVHRDGVAGYKKFDPTDCTYRNDYGLLEGVAGIGLVLISYINNDFSWDYCLMLSD